MHMIQHFFCLLGVRRHQTRDIARLERELNAQQKRVVDLRTKQLVAGNRQLRLVRKRTDLDRRFAEVLKDGETLEAASISTEAAHVVRQIEDLEAGSDERRAELVRALTTFHSTKQSLVEAQLDRSTTNGRLSKLLWGGASARRSSTNL